MIGYAGLSHLGIVSAAAAARKGFPVVAWDPDLELCAAVAAARPPIVEPGLTELLTAVGSALTVTTDVATLGRCDVIYVSIDVPTDDASRSDVSPVRTLLQHVIAIAKPGATIVVLSQVAPGFTRSMRALVERGSAKGLRLYYQVETLVFGRAIQRALEPERFMVGCAAPTDPLPAPLGAFLEAFGCPVLRMRYESAELCKISINMFLVSSIATTNMLAGICEAIGAEWREIAPALRLDARIGPDAYLTPGLGIGGGNLTRDLETIRVIAWQTGTDAGLVDEWLAQSLWRRDWALRMLNDRVLTQRADARVAVWGVAYKENTQSTKNSPSVSMLRVLRGLDVAVYDPEARLDEEDARSVRVAASALDACRTADALVVMTPWPVFAELDLRQAGSAMRGRVLIDPFGRLDDGRARAASFEYLRLGSGATPSMAGVSC
jgi:UDPglucose 6-dehydrogenase